MKLGRDGICRGDGGSPVLYLEYSDNKFVQSALVMGTIPWYHVRCTHEYPAVHISLTNRDVLAFIKDVAFPDFDDSPAKKDPVMDFAIDSRS